MNFILVQGKDICDSPNYEMDSPSHQFEDLFENEGNDLELTIDEKRDYLQLKNVQKRLSALKIENEQEYEVTFATFGDSCLLLGTKQGAIRIDTCNMKPNRIITEKPIEAICEMKMEEDGIINTYILYTLLNESMRTSPLPLPNVSQEWALMSHVKNFYQQLALPKSEYEQTNQNQMEEKKSTQQRERKKRLYFYSQQMNTVIYEFELPDDEPIIGIRYVKDHIIIIKQLIQDVYKINSNGTLSYKLKIPTAPNTYGICTTSQNAQQPIIATLGTEKGTVQVRNLKKLKTTIIKAHANSIRNIAMNQNGTMIATASTTGTIIHLWGLDNYKEPLKDFRRGSMAAEIESITFSPKDTSICVTSSRSMHIFNIAGAQNLTSYLNGIPGYFSSEWSLKKCSSIRGPALAKFERQDVVLVVTPTKVHRVVFIHDIPSITTISIQELCDQSLK